MRKLYTKIILVLVALVSIMGLNQSTSATKINLSNDEIYQISKKATVYGYPTAEFYRVMYVQSIGVNGPGYKAPFNQIVSDTKVLGPKDTNIQSPNADTPYSLLWLDLRSDDIVLTMPKIDKNRYYSAQIIDSYTYDVDYLGTRKDGNDGGNFLIVGPNSKWNGTTPAGIKRVVKLDTEFAYVIYRNQLFNAQDMPNVMKVQEGYKIQTLSKYLGQKEKPAAPDVKWPVISKDNEFDAKNFYTILNSMLQFMPEFSDEKALRAEIAKIGIVPGKVYDTSQMTPEQQKAVNSGIQDALKEIKANISSVQSFEDYFGTREFLKDNYMAKSVAAMLGLFGNVKDEAMYFNYQKDSNNQSYDTSKNNYILHFDKDQFPPVNAFWSLTMYDSKTFTMVENPLNRYLINSTMIKDFKRDKNGGVDIYIQKNSPGKNLESNWLPAPDGEFYIILRAYLPKEEILNGKWKQPAIQINKK